MRYWLGRQILSPGRSTATLPGVSIVPSEPEVEPWSWPLLSFLLVVQVVAEHYDVAAAVDADD